MADFVNKGDAPLAHAVHEGLLKVSDRVRQETAAQSTLGVGDAKSRGDVESMLAFAKKCVFQSVFLLTNPAMGSGGLWIVERLIIWLQVRVAVLRELGRTLANRFFRSPLHAASVFSACGGAGTELGRH